MGYFMNAADEADSAFYSAFEFLDLDLMKAVWFRSNEVTCIHPGGPVQTGYDAVIKHWAFILQGSQQTPIQVRRLSRLVRDELAVFLVEEAIGNARPVKVLATNTFIHTANGWRLFAHHASLPADLAAHKPAGPLH